MERSFSDIASLIAEPTRSEMLMALMDGQSKTASELAVIANISPSTASHHLGILARGGLIEVLQSGRERYHKLAGYQVAELLELLGSVGKPRRITAKEALTPCRSCYDHLAGKVGVAFRAVLEERGFIHIDGAQYRVSPEGEDYFGELGIDIGALRAGKRVFAKACLDWTERVPHVGGALGAALLGTLLERRWIERGGLPRQILLTPVGRERLERLGLSVRPIRTTYSATGPSDSSVEFR